VEVEEAEVEKWGKGINWATEVKGKGGEAHHSAIWGALHSEPRGGTGVRSSPVGEKVAVGVG